MLACIVSVDSVDSREADSAYGENISESGSDNDGYTGRRHGDTRRERESKGPQVRTTLAESCGEGRERSSTSPQTSPYVPNTACSDYTYLSRSIATLLLYLVS